MAYIPITDEEIEPDKPLTSSILRRLRDNIDYLLPLVEATINTVGFMTDGTPLYAMELTITITNGNTTGNVAHGIANAMTNGRIVSVCSRYYNTGFNYSSAIGIEGGAIADTHLRNISWNNTTMTAIRPGNVGNVDFIIFVVYR